MDQIIITSDRDAVRKVKQYFPTFDDTAAERLKKGAIIRYLREQEPYKEAFEKEYRRQWIKNSLDIYHMLLESGRDKRQISSGLDSIMDKAHSEFYVCYFKLKAIESKTFDRDSKVSYTTNRHSSMHLDRAGTYNKIKWALADKYQDRVEV